MEQLPKDQIVLLLFRVKFGDPDDIHAPNSIATVGNLFKINNSKQDLSRVYDHLKALLSIKDESYTSLPLLEVIFSYKIVSLDNKTINKSNRINKKLNLKATTYKMKGYNLPNTMDLKLWGVLIDKLEDGMLIRKKSSQYIYDIKILEDPLTYNVTLNLSNNKEIHLSFTDKINSEFNNLNSFTRYIGSNEYYFVNGELVLKLNPRKVSFLEVLSLFKKRKGKNINPVLDEKFITLDIETRVINGIIKPILICVFDGKNFKNFFISDYNSTPDTDDIGSMVNSVLTYLIQPKYNNYKIYIHNLSNFDGIFLLKYIVKFIYRNKKVIVKPIMKNGKMINIDIIFDQKFRISLRDSYLILLASLKKLAKAFEIEDKGTFDFNKVNNLNKQELLIFKEELIIYCNKDCKILFLIIKKFNKLIFDKWILNINNFPTLPSIAFGLFRSKFLSKNEIPNLTGQTYLDIKESYTGGSVDMIVPYGKDIYYYDVNSLYPSVMANKPMPIGEISAFEGNILATNSDAFGFFRCEIVTPKNLNIPILQIHNNNKTVSPLGKFTGWFFSEELKYARDHFGYKFKILNGYIFDQKIIFKDYVNELYNLRLTFDKTNPMNYVAKILMNSLYGRFGLSPILPESMIVSNDELDKLVDLGEISELIDFDDDSLLISFLSFKEINAFPGLLFSNESKCNIAIASATIAYSRMVLAETKKYCLDNDIKLYYFDTDSIFTDKPLPENLIGKNLGQWKLEDKISEAVFICSKVYGYINSDGKEIVKAKGYKNKITFIQLKSLLEFNKKLTLPQEKWYKSIDEGTITIKDQLYTLQVTSNKRNLMCCSILNKDKNKILYNTFPFYITKNN